MGQWHGGCVSVQGCPFVRSTRWRVPCRRRCFRFATREDFALSASGMARARTYNAGCLPFARGLQSSPPPLLGCVPFGKRDRPRYYRHVGTSHALFDGHPWSSSRRSGSAPCRRVIVHANFQFILRIPDSSVGSDTLTQTRIAIYAYI
jgi:hypothetical protein